MNPAIASSGFLELVCRQSSALIDIDTDRLRLDVVTVPELGPVTNDDFRDAESINLLERQAPHHAKTEEQQAASVLS
ncbi:hypothetical protein AnigIFM59636_003728 [Aspergillus niger]|nr:hypothetical protein AnigIFM59636_003728 [Aspergillus niger]